MARDVKFVIPRSFLKAARGVFSSRHIETLKDKLALYPELGAMIPGTGGARKIRQAGEAGQSRLVYYYHSGDGEIFFLTCYAKNDKKDLTQDEKEELRETIKTIKNVKGR